MRRADLYRACRIGLCALLTGQVLQAGCTPFLIAEIEALLAPTAAGNALYVLDSVLFGLLAPLIY